MLRDSASKAEVNLESFGNRMVVGRNPMVARSTALLYKIMFFLLARAFLSP
jgi:hypothetical protein